MKQCRSPEWKERAEVPSEIYMKIYTCYGIGTGPSWNKHRMATPLVLNNIINSLFYRILVTLISCYILLFLLNENGIE